MGWQEKIEKYTTGKFSIETVYSKNKDQTLIVHVEMKKNIKIPSFLKGLIQKSVLSVLLKNSTEYNYLYTGGSKLYKKRILPQIKLYPHGHKKHFNNDGKQRWIKK